MYLMHYDSIDKSPDQKIGFIVNACSGSGNNADEIQCPQPSFEYLSITRNRRTLTVHPAGN